MLQGTTDGSMPQIIQIQSQPQQQQQQQQQQQAQQAASTQVFQQVVTPSGEVQNVPVSTNRLCINLHK